jgi:membrane-bound lytic murein transglycosylase B
MWLRIFKTLALISLVAMPACASAPQPAASANTAPRLFNSVITAAVIPVPRLKPAYVSAADKQKKFDLWKADFTQRAIAKGYPAPLVRSVIAPAKINELALERDKTQPEFTSPIWEYVDRAASPARLANGRAALKSNDAVFRSVEGRYRVSPHILTAIWGLETSYGRIQGDHDIPSSLATFAFEGRRTAFGEEQLFAVLDILRSGAVSRGQLVGSWAGAMGNTQFIPTTFRDYAIDFDGDGRKDLWKSEADALGSAANYLSRFGWEYGVPSFAEVRLPSGFNYAAADGSARAISDWQALGVAPVNGKNWGTQALPMQAKLIIPAGARGPAILTFKNFDVIKRYNNSTSYALGISMLAEALAGRPTLQTPWPKSDKRVALKDLIRMQKKLTSLGYDTGGADGIIGPNTRRAIQNWQSANGLPADGYIEKNMFKKIMNTAG